MKRILLALSIVAVSISYSAMTHSEENTTRLPNEYGQMNSEELHGQKDECLIVAKNCNIIGESVMQRVERLQREIRKGTDVYTSEELKYLQQQLEWIKSDNAGYSAGMN